MKYTKYFAQLVKSHGSPQLQGDSMRTFLNIIYLEAKIQLYQKLNNGCEYTGNIYRNTKLLEELTGKIEPKMLVQKWLTGETIPSFGQQPEDKPWDENEKYLVQKPQDDFKSRSRRR